MALDPWYRVAQPREEVREGRSFNPDEFANRAGAGRCRHGTGRLP